MRFELVTRQRKTLRLYEEKVAKYRRQLRTVVDRRLPLARKKKLIVQRGEFLVPLLTAVLPTLVSLIYDGLKK